MVNIMQANMFTSTVTKLVIIAISIELVELKQKQIYELDADDFVGPIIGDIYKARTNLDRVTKPATNISNNYNATRRDARKYFSNAVNGINDDKARTMANHTDAASLNITTPKRRRLNITMEQIKMRRLKMYTEKVLSDNFTIVPDFANGDDDPGVLTRRFDSMRRVATKYLYYTRETNIEKKMKIFALMQQFVYHIRYLLPISQLLRKKYFDSYSYKIGFCMCTFTLIFYHMRRLSSTMVFYLQTFPNLYVHMKIYERIVRLYVDVKDLTRLMKKLEYEKKMAQDPKFYDISLETDENDK